MRKIAGEVSIVLSHEADNTANHGPRPIIHYEVTAHFKQRIREEYINHGGIKPVIAIYEYIIILHLCGDEFRKHKVRIILMEPKPADVRAETLLDSLETSIAKPALLQGIDYVEAFERLLRRESMA